MTPHGFPRGFLVLIAALVLAPVPGAAESPPDDAAREPMDALVTTAWLGEHLADPDLVVLDCTVNVVMGEDGGMDKVSGRAAYEQGHIPTAGFADLLVALSDPDSPLENALPTAERFCAAMEELGVGDDSRVVLYDGNYSVWAARVWWMLRWVGFDRAAVLDGGFRAWSEEDRAVSTEPARHPARHLTPRPRPSLIADKDEVFAAIDDEAVLLVDAMPAPHYQGKMALYDRRGHIPGAINVPATAVLDGSGRYRPREELAALVDADRSARVITYCGSGIAASSVALVLHRLGYADVAVYAASLQEWAADPDNPLEVDRP